VAIITPTTWQTWANQTLTGGDLASLSLVCNQVDAAIKSRIWRKVERQTYTLVMPAPPTNVIQLARYAPIEVEGFAISCNTNAQGDPTAFTSADLLTMYQDYMLDVGPDDNESSWSGMVINLKGSWGVQGWRPNYSIAFQTTGIPGAILTTFTAGYANIPLDLVEAACLAVSKIRQLRKFGTGVQSESWNGDSYSLGSQAWMYGILGDPVISSTLSRYENKQGFIG
jgi:hypothetical protein